MYLERGCGSWKYSVPGFDKEEGTLPQLFSFYKLLSSKPRRLLIFTILMAGDHTCTNGKEFLVSLDFYNQIFPSLLSYPRVDL